jgi:hypothetical protein
LGNTPRGVSPSKATRLTQYPAFCGYWIRQISLSALVYPESGFWKTFFGNHDRAADTASITMRQLGFLPGRGLHGLWIKVVISLTRYSHLDFFVNILG